jgi:hypothetical protein
MCVGGMSPIVGKFSMRAITFLKTLSQSQICTRSYGAQNGKSPNFGNFKTFNLGVPRKMRFGCNLCGQSWIILWEGRWWLFPNSGHGESCGLVYAHGSSMHQKCCNYALTNLLTCCLICVSPYK